MKQMNYQNLCQAKANGKFARVKHAKYKFSNKSQIAAKRKSIRIKNFAAFAVVAFFAGTMLLPALWNSNAATETRLITVDGRPYNPFANQDHDMKFYEAGDHFVYAVDPENDQEAVAFYSCKRFAAIYSDYCHSNKAGQDIKYEIASHVNIDGKIYPVTIFGDNGFNGATGLFCHVNSLEVILPETLRYISQRAFDWTTGCKNPFKKQIEIPASVETIGAYAFSNQHFDELHLNEVNYGPFAFANTTIDKLYIDNIDESVTTIRSEIFDKFDEAYFSHPVTRVNKDILGPMYFFNDTTIKDIYFSDDSINTLMNIPIKDKDGSFQQYVNIFNGLARHSVTRFHVPCDVELVKPITDVELEMLIRDRLFKKYGLDPNGDFEAEINKLDDDMQEKFNADYNKMDASTRFLLNDVENFIEDNGHELIRDGNCEARPENPNDKSNEENPYQANLNNPDHRAANNGIDNPAKNTTSQNLVKRDKLRQTKLMPPNTAKK